MAVEKIKGITMEIRKLRREEHSQTKALWKTVFEEDTEEFLEYYYNVKTLENEIYVSEDHHHICAMLHLNPYQLQIGESQNQGNYIVAVATQQKYRKQGIMASLLKVAMNEMYRRKEPFTFLMPAAEAIYRPFDFRFIYQQGQAIVKGKKTRDNDEIQIRMATKEDSRMLANFANEWLEKRYQIYVRRNQHYYDALLGELQSEDGGIALVYQNSEFIGQAACVKENGYQVREPMFCKEDIHALPYVVDYITKGDTTKIPCIGYGQEVTKPMIMGRIIHAETCLRFLEVREALCCCFTIEDSILEQNTQTFMIQGDARGITVTKVVRSKSQGEISIAALTSFIFGDKTLEELECEEGISLSSHLQREFAKIIPFSRIYLNEIV
ncbi:MAG: GNAT family N-acetyltransferase [Lachnospiraceae bacterium]